MTRLILMAAAAAVTLAGCGSADEHSSSTRRVAGPPTSAGSDAQQPAGELAGAVSRMSIESFTSVGRVSFRLDAGRAAAGRLRPWQKVFPVWEISREQLEGNIRTLTNTSSAGTVRYVITPSSASIVRGGRRQALSGALLAAIRDGLAARQAFLNRLPAAGHWQVLSRRGSELRHLALDPAPVTLAADVLPGFARHPDAVRQAKLAIDVYLDRAGRLAETRVALSCLVDLNAIASRSASRAAWVGLGMVSTAHITALR